MDRMKIAVAMFVVCMTLMFSGCAKQFRIAKDTAASMFVVWEETQMIVAVAYKDGEISEYQWLEFVQIDKKFRETFQVYVSALRLWEKVGQDNDDISKIYADTFKELFQIILDARKMASGWGVKL